MFSVTSMFVSLMSPDETSVWILVPLISERAVSPLDVDVLIDALSIFISVMLPLEATTLKFVGSISSMRISPLVVLMSALSVTLELNNISPLESLTVVFPNVSAASVLTSELDALIVRS